MNTTTHQTTGAKHTTTTITELAKDHMVVTCASCDWTIPASDWITACRLATKHELKGR